jgi:hypothetical protein
MALLLLPAQNLLQRSKGGMVANMASTWQRDLDISLKLHHKFFPILLSVYQHYFPSDKLRLEPIKQNHHEPKNMSRKVRTSTRNVDI